MKIERVPGEFAFRALVPLTKQNLNNVFTIPGEEWKLSENYFFSLEDAQKMLGQLIKWPVEVYDDGAIYIPSPEELNA